MTTTGAWPTGWRWVRTWRDFLLEWARERPATEPEPHGVLVTVRLKDAGDEGWVRIYHVDEETGMDEAMRCAVVARGIPRAVAGQGAALAFIPATPRCEGCIGRAKEVQTFMLDLLGCPDGRTVVTIKGGSRGV